MALKGAKKEVLEELGTTLAGNENPAAVNMEIVLPWKDLEGLLLVVHQWAQKALRVQAKQLRELEDRLIDASQNGKYPILCDTSPCVKAMIKGFSSNLKILEPIEFTLKYSSAKTKI